MARLEGKVAMVTGSGGERGFGRVIARRLAAEGADLVLTDVEPTGVRAVPAKAASGWGGLPAVAAEVKGEGRRALTALADVRSAARWRPSSSARSTSSAASTSSSTTPARRPASTGRRWSS